MATMQSMATDPLRSLLERAFPGAEELEVVDRTGGGDHFHVIVQTDRFEHHAGAPDEERMKKILAHYPLRRLGQPSDISPLVLLLASPLSGWTTGQVISVNGGYAMP